MIKSAASKVMWVGRATVFLIGLAVILALVFGVASTVSAHTGNKGFFHLGHKNVSKAVSTLVKQGPGPALNLVVQSGQPPLNVNSTGRVPRLNADMVDGKHAGAFLPKGGKAADADKLDGLNSTAMLPGGDLPRDRTLRGTYSISSFIRPWTQERTSFSISFGYRLASAPQVRVVKATTTPPPECPGTAQSPEASPGFLCVYELVGSGFESAAHPYPFERSRYGANMGALSRYNGSNTNAYFTAWGTWAVTGN